MDAPLWLHWPKLGLWVTLEGILLGLTLVVQTRSDPPVVWNPAISDCRFQAWDCSFNGERVDHLGACALGGRTARGLRQGHAGAAAAA